VERIDILAIADDLTGALEVGAQIAEQGVCAPVFVKPRRCLAPVAVVNANTRHEPPRVAAAIVRSIVTNAVHVFLKTDSTLRGPIAESFAALLEVCPERKILYAPAYPALRRSVVGGRLFVDGVPLERTEFTRDLLNPVRNGSIIEMLAGVLGAECVCGGRPDQASELLRRGRCRVVVCDGDTVRDLDEAARAMRRAGGLTLIAAGPAGFAGAWARTLEMPRSQRPPNPRARSGIIVCGSRHPRSRAQIRYASARGVPALVLDPDGAIESLLERIDKQPWTILVTPDEACGEPLQLAARCGAIVRTVLDRAPRDALVVFGGDTALAIMSALGYNTAYPYGELLPGVAAAKIGDETTYTLVTKAGGFAGDDVIEQILTRLEGDR
jgi:uncharacterized protein YgbK (DUF1537 family)